ncbi:hypothetical protein SAY86_012833 [Trapa natans]|uniref:Uncharacterized protein n=1 Tax=Trapa natans TaxID=22666 RepID=A0AAN7R7L2_TRANT|nr:hypothetical protein SAY86_012833 [Trapa natans]
MAKEWLEEEQVGIQKDIDQLMLLSQKLKEQRENLTKEREPIISFSEKQSSGNNCDMQYLSEMENLEIPHSNFLVDNQQQISQDAETLEGQKADASPNVGSMTPVNAHQRYLISPLAKRATAILFRT